MATRNVWQEYWLACQQDKARQEKMAREVADRIDRDGYITLAPEPPKKPTGKPPRRKFYVPTISFFGTIALGDFALFAAQYGQDMLARTSGVLFVLNFALMLASVRVVYR